MKLTLRGWAAAARPLQSRSSRASQHRRRELDKSGALLRFLTNERSYGQAEHDAAYLHETAFGDGESSEVDKKTTSWYMSPYSTFKRAMTGKVDTTQVEMM